MIVVALIGCGVVGGALKTWLMRNNQDVDIRVVDTGLGINDNISDCNACFIQIPVQTKENGCQDIDELLKCIDSVGDKDIPVFIRSTITPKIVKSLQWGYAVERHWMCRVYYMPEFLSDSSADSDFSNQVLVCPCIGNDGRQDVNQEKDENVFRRIFVGRKIRLMSSVEASIAKYAHNTFGALKVSFFSALWKLACDFDSSLDLPYRAGRFSDIKDVLFDTGHVDQMYTEVPGHDGLIGFGGKCFDKDLRAFVREYQHDAIGKLLQNVDDVNCAIRRNGFSTDEECRKDFEKQETI